jgi:hypothetical protein
MVDAKLLFYEEAQCKQTVSAVPRPNSAAKAAEVIRSPEAVQSPPTSVFRLFPGEDEASRPPTSTAPPRLKSDYLD